MVLAERSTVSAVLQFARALIWPIVVLVAFLRPPPPWWQFSLSAGDVALLLNSTAQVARAVAWPVVAVYVLYRYPDQIDSLVKRVRKIAGAEIDPPPTQQVPHASHGPVTALTGSLEAKRTDVVKRTEGEIWEMPVIKDAANDAERVKTLVTLTALIYVLQEYEKLDLTIWGSQQRALEALSVSPSGLTKDAIKSDFYQPMAAESSVVAEYTFDRWLAFLLESGVVEVGGEGLKLTDRGRGYLLWRTQRGKPPRPHF